MASAAAAALFAAAPPLAGQAEDVAGIVPAAFISRAGALPAAAELSFAVDSVSARRHRNPWVAGGLAYVFPGAGHFYAGEPRRGWLVIGLTGVGVNFALNDAAPAGFATAGAVLALGTWALSVVDAPRAAKRQNRRAAERASIVPR